MSKLPASNNPVLSFTDLENEAMVKFVDHEGFVYIEVTTRHGFQLVSSLVKVNRDRFVPNMLGWFT